MSDAIPVETEVKIPVAALDAVRDRLAACGGTRDHPAERELNILLDTAGNELDAAGLVLRLRRRGARRRLTLKGPATFVGNIKSREELETDVGDVEALVAIFERLGFRPAVRYEKDRETWRLDDIMITLDHTPMGDFVELEGEAARLGALAGRLGLSLDDAVKGSYPGLWRSYRADHPELDLPEDMVFAP